MDAVVEDLDVPGQPVEVRRHLLRVEPPAGRLERHRTDRLRSGPRGRQLGERGRQRRQRSRGLPGVVHLPRR